ncbi:GlxA family transcriptional regulator [Solwaraspora sp. WMMB335]|uniref:GlxA family transcriptional regulator n=1 Tax=Solwaraspora sp. WMMB335 TaxID=3404118 RepID=UPI003B94B369
MQHPQSCTDSSRLHRIAVLALEHMLPMEVGMPFLVFGAPQLRYEVLLCGRTPGPIETDHGWPILAPHGLDALVTADTVIVPAFRGFLDDVPDDALAALRLAHRNGARIASICTGAFALAAAGLLDGRRATTHWQYTDELARRHPTVEVDPGVLYVDAGDVVTSAGVASGIDLCLHLLRRDRGAAAANKIASGIVAAPYREGGQAQFIRRPSAPPRPGGLGATQDWALRRLDQPLTVTDLADHARLPLRTFERRFTAETGSTPIRWLNAARIDRARELLETTDVSIEHVGRLCGLGTPANFRQHFRRATGTTPREYRRAFAAA